MVYLAHRGSLYPYTQDKSRHLFHNSCIHFASPERSRYWSWLIHRNAESFIIWSIMSSWFCHGELGSKRVPITYSSIFTLATKLQQTLLCVLQSIPGICVQGSVGQIWLLKFQSVDMPEKLQTASWTVLMYSPWTSSNQKCMGIGNTFWNNFEIIISIQAI